MPKFYWSVIIISLSYSLSQGQAQVVTKPEIDFVNSASKTPDVSYLPRSEEVYCLELDLNGNGKKTIFLTFERWGSRTGYLWIAYFPVVGGYSRVKDATGGQGIVFRPDGFYALDHKGGLFVLQSGRDGGNLVHYDIENGVVQMQKIQFIDYGKSADKKYVENILGRKLEDHSSENHPAYKVLTVTGIESGTE